MHYCNTVQERSPVVCFTESSGEQGRRLSGMEGRVVSDNAATDSGWWRSARSDNAGRGGWRKVSERVQLLVVGDAQSSYNDVMAEERLVGGAALQTVLLYSGRRYCGRCGGGA